MDQGLEHWFSKLRNQAKRMAICHDFKRFRYQESYIQSSGLKEMLVEEVWKSNQEREAVLSTGRATMLEKFTALWVLEKAGYCSDHWKKTRAHRRPPGPQI